MKRRCTIYNIDQELAEAFIENPAVFHKSFASVFNKRELNRNKNTLNRSMFVMQLKTLLSLIHLKFQPIIATLKRFLEFF